MSLFRRSNPVDTQTTKSNASNFDEIELPSASDLSEPDFSPKEPQVSLSDTIKVRSSKQGYGIEDAIQLMKSLPRDNPEVVVTVVKKTLESTQIQVQDILNDAKEKEERIRSKHKALEAEIKQLQEQISKRNQQISDLVQDLNETTDVRQQLELALELDGSKNKKADEAVTSTVKTTTGPNVAVQSGNTGSYKANPTSVAGAKPASSFQSRPPTQNPIPTK